MKENANEMHTVLSDERTMPIKTKLIESKLKVGEWFYIDREVINENKEEIRRKCDEAGEEGKVLWRKFEYVNKIADENPDKYSNFMETYIFDIDYAIMHAEMEDMCDDVGDGICDEIICHLELQMRICYGEPVDDLVIKADKLPRRRFIKLRNGRYGIFGGSADWDLGYTPTPSECFYSFSDDSYRKVLDETPYAFRRVSKRNVTGTKRNVTGTERNVTGITKKEKEARFQDKNDEISKAKNDNSVTSKPEVGRWFRIDRDVINNSKEEIHRKCYEEGEKGKVLWKRFEKSNKIADENPERYTNLIETYVFEHNGECACEREMRDMCDDVGDGMCDEVICDLELQMRICNGESVYDLVIKADEFPLERIIKFRDGITGIVGGATKYGWDSPPARICNHDLFVPWLPHPNSVPYAFRNVSKKEVISKLNGEEPIILKPNNDEQITSKGPKVGEWFRIDRDVINNSKQEIRRKCYEAKEGGRDLWKRFEESNKIADANFDQYTNLIETYIFEHSWEYKTAKEMRDMCDNIGDGMCDEVICDLELQMRICNGESVYDLIRRADKIPYSRYIKFRNGDEGCFGGDIYYDREYYVPPEQLYSSKYCPDRKIEYSVPYAFRCVSKKEIPPKLKDDEQITSKGPKVGEWFRIDRKVINKNKEEIRSKCYEAGIKGKALWERFEEANEIADSNPVHYTNLIETYIFEHNGECADTYDKMCDDVICNLELQMRICNGESVDDLIYKRDKLPYMRRIDGYVGWVNGIKIYHSMKYFGGGTADNYNNPPVYFRSNTGIKHATPYVFRRVY